MVELILPESAKVAEELPYESIYSKTEYTIDFTGWKKGTFPVGFWQLHERLREFVEDKDNGGHVAGDMQRLLKKLAGVMRVVGQVSTQKEQYELLLESSYTLKTICEKNTKIKALWSVNVVHPAVVPSDDEEQLVRYSDGVQAGD